MGAHHDNGHAHGNLRLKLKVWRQANSKVEGRFEDYRLDDVSPDMSFLEMLDILNQQLIQNGQDPISFDHDCREGICGSCGFVIDGAAHGPDRGTTVCQLHMRRFKDGDEIVVEPFRARAFPIVKDLSVDRSSLDRIIASGGFVSVNVGNAPDGNAIPVPKDAAELAMDAAQCIGCGACVAACKNASAMLFTSAKVSHLAYLPQGQPEREERVRAMVLKMDEEGFGNCTNTQACSAACPKEIAFENIARMNRDFSLAMLLGRK